MKKIIPVLALASLLCACSVLAPKPTARAKFGAVAATPSPNGAKLVGPTAAGSLIDATGNTWTLTGGQLSENGGAPTGLNIILTEYCGGLIYQENASTLWWDSVSGAWVATTAPATCGAIIAAGGNANLSWTPPTTDVKGGLLASTPGDALTGFNIYQGVGAGSLVKIASVAANVLNYTVSGLTVGSYTFAVTATNAAGESADSPSQTASVEPVVPAAAAPGPVLTFTVACSGQNGVTTCTVTVP